MCAHDKADVSDEVKKKMYRQDKIFFDGEIGPHISSENAPSNDGRNALERMHELKRDGGLVYLRANKSYPKWGKIGYVTPGTPIEILEVDGGTWIKAMQVGHVIEFHEDDQTGLFDADEFRPGRGTVHNVNKNPEIIMETYSDIWGPSQFPWE